MSFFLFYFLPSSLQSLSSLSNHSSAIHFFYSAANLSNSIQPLLGSSKKKKNIGKRIHRGEMASRKRTGGGRKDRGTEWDELREKDIYTTREEIREKKKWAPPGAGKKGGKRAKSVYILYAYFFLFFLCIFTNTRKDGSFVHIFMYTQKRKNVYVKLHTANKADVIRAYVYVCILKKCSGWFRCADFRKFCAGLFAYFFCWQQEKYVCLYVQKRKQNVYVYIHKKRTKCICLRMQNLK